MALTDEGLLDIPEMHSRYVRLPSGAKAHYVTSGHTGPAVVLLHGGITGSSGMAGWRHMAPFLGANGFRVFCPDVVGFGFTEDPAQHYQLGPHGYNEFLHDFVDALCLDSFHISGNSMGCDIAASYAVSHPERVRSMALIATRNIGWDFLDPADLEAIRVRLGLPVDVSEDVPYDGSEAMMREWMESIIRRKEEITDDLITMRTLAARRHMEDYETIVNQPPWTANQTAALTTRGRLDKLTIPAIYLYGAGDSLASVEGAYLQEDGLPHIQFFYPQDCGHQGQTDQPEMFNTAFLEFFRDGRVSRATADWAGVSQRRPELADVVEQR